MIINFEGDSSEPAIPPFIMHWCLCLYVPRSRFNNLLCRPKFAMPSLRTRQHFTNSAPGGKICPSGTVISATNIALRIVRSTSCAIDGDGLGKAEGNKETARKTGGDDAKLLHSHVTQSQRRLMITCSYLYL